MGIYSTFYTFSFLCLYAYAFGDCLVNSLYSKYEEGISDFHNKYVELLSSGGSQHYQYHLKKFDLDPQNKDFWQLGMNLIKNLIDDLENLG